MPDLIGCDMGSIDIGPTYLGTGEMATVPVSGDTNWPTNNGN